MPLTFHIIDPGSGGFTPHTPAVAPQHAAVAAGHIHVLTTAGAYGLGVASTVAAAALGIVSYYAIRQLRARLAARRARPEPVDSGWDPTIRRSNWIDPDILPVEHRNSVGLLEDGLDAVTALRDTVAYYRSRPSRTPATEPGPAATFHTARSRNRRNTRRGGAA